MSDHRGAQEEKSSPDKVFFVKLFHDYSKLMFHTAKRYESQGVDIHDIVQESFLNLLMHESQLKALSNDALISYIYFTVKNTAISLSRFRNKINSNELPLEEETGDILQNIDITMSNVEIRSLVEEVFAALPENDKMLLTYKYLLGYSNLEISKKVGCKLESVRMKLSRARQRALHILADSKEDNK